MLIENIFFKTYVNFLVPQQIYYSPKVLRTSNFKRIPFPGLSVSLPAFTK